MSRIGSHTASVLTYSPNRIATFSLEDVSQVKTMIRAHTSFPSHFEVTKLLGGDSNSYVMLSWCSSGELLVHDAMSGKYLSELKLAIPDIVATSAAIHAPVIAIATKNGDVRSVVLDSSYHLSIVSFLNVSTDVPSMLRMCPSGRLLFICADDRLLVLKVRGSSCPYPTLDSPSALSCLDICLSMVVASLHSM